MNPLHVVTKHGFAISTNNYEGLLWWKMFTIQFNVEVPKMYECILCNMAVHFPRMEQSLMNLLLRILYREPNIGEGTVPNQLVCVFSDKCPQLPIV